MSGVKRRSGYRKNVVSNVMNEYPEPDKAKGEMIAQIACSRGGNLFEILLPGVVKPKLCRMPTKFRKLIWVKRNDFVIVSSAEGDFEIADGSCGKVLHNIEHILYKDQIKHLKKSKLWPEEFADDLPASEDKYLIRASGSLDDDGYFRNVNRVVYSDCESESDDGFDF